MARGVVHRLEPIDVAQHDAEDVAVARRLRQLRAETLHQAAPVQDAREVVVAGEPARLRDQVGVRDGDRDLRRVQAKEPTRLVRENAPVARVGGQRTHDLAAGDERRGDRRCDEVVQQRVAVGMRAVIAGDHEIPRADRLKRDAAKGLTDRDA